MRLLLVLILLMTSAVPVAAGEVFLFYGATDQQGVPDRSFSYAAEYREGLGEHWAISIGYLNEGHLPNHHRDGLAPLTLWWRMNVMDRRLSLAVGAGPYVYADTTENPPGVVLDRHGVGGLLGGSATWYFDSRFLLQARVNWINTKDSIDTLTALVGIGYQLDAPVKTGPLPRPPFHREKKTDNELTLFVGETSVNNPGSPKSLAWSVEYRRGLYPYLDVSASWLNEGDNVLIRRNGLITELWPVRSFFNDRLSLGCGLGAYLAVDHRNEDPSGEGGSAFASGIMSATVSLQNFSFDPNWTARFVMHRIVTNYNKDTDIFLVGLGYRF